LSRGGDGTRGASAIAIRAFADGPDVSEATEGSGGACADARAQMKNKTRLI
jgi:hypothetical protein